MHYAVHEHTAAEVIYERVDNEKPNVGMTSFKGVRAKVLVGNGHVTHEEAMAKAEEEFNAYRARELRRLESDFDKAMKKFLKTGEKEGQVPGKA